MYRQNPKKPFDSHPALWVDTYQHVRSIHLKIFALFILFFCTSAHSSITNTSSTTLRIDDNYGSINLINYIHVLEDPDAELNFYNVRQSDKFRKLDRAIYGFSDATFWIKIEIINQTKHRHWFLEKSFANTHELDLYQKDTKGNYQLNRGGALKMLTPSGYQYRKPLFYLTLPTDKRSTIYIRYKSGASINFHMLLWPDKAFDKKMQEESFWQGLFYGILLLLVIVNVSMLIRRFVHMQGIALVYSLTLVSCVIVFDGTLITYSPTLFWSVQTYFFPVLLAAFIIFSFTAYRIMLANVGAHEFHFKLIDSLNGVLIFLGFLGVLFSTKPFSLGVPPLVIISIIYTIYIYGKYSALLPLASKLFLLIILITQITFLTQTIYVIGIIQSAEEVSETSRLILMYCSVTCLAIYPIFYITRGNILDSSLEGYTSNINLNALFNKSFNFIAFLDKEGKIKAVNSKPPFTEVENDIFINQAFHSLPGLDSSEEQKTTIQECIENAKNNLNARTELSVQKKTGEEYWIDFSFSPFVDNEKNVNTIIVEGRDITNQKRAESALRKVAEAGPMNDLEQTLHHFVKEISLLLNAKYAFIGEYDKVRPNTIRTRSLCCDGVVSENISYNIHDTASKNVINEEFCIIPRDASSVYPNDELINRLDIESYVGAPLIDSTGEMLGILCVLDNKPVAQSDRFDEVLQIFSNRIAAELERTNIEIEKKEATEKLTFHIQNSPLAYIECDESFNVVDWNPAAERLFGYSRNEVLDNPISQYVFSEDANTSKDDNIRSIIANKHGRFTRTRNINKRGETLICEWHNTLLLSPEGKLLGISSLIVDITAEEEALQSIKEKELEQRETLETLNDCVIIFNSKSEILSINQSTVDLFGYQSSELIGCHFKILIPEFSLTPADIKRKIEQYRELEVNAKNSKGDYFPVSLTISSLPISEDKPPRYIGVCRDLSIIKLQQEQLRRSQKMDALGKLTGGIAHDFNNILGVITGYTDLLNMISKDEKVLRYSKEIRHASDRGAKLTNKLLSFSSKHTGNFSVVNINTILEENQHMLERTLSPKVNFKYVLEADLWLTETDSNELEDTILNLSINAMHAIDDSGTVCISTHNQILSQEQANTLSLNSGNYVVLKVKDTGKGIPQELVDKIFDPFFTTKGDKGTGLGLSQVYGFMERNGGGVFVDSTPGIGTTFSLYFPQTGESEISDTATAAESPMVSTSNAQYTVLAIDDNTAMLSMLKEILELNGFQVIATAKPQDALTLLETHTVDIVISDIMMPVLNGYDLADAITARYPSIKIQLVSGYVEDDDGRRKDHALTGSLVKKPYQADELIKKLSMLMTR